MKILLRVLVVLAAVESGIALAEEPKATPPSAPPAAAPVEAVPDQVPAPPASSEAQTSPQEGGPTAEAQPPAPPAGVPAGQWSHTGQYGWVWMPYAQNYTYVPDYGDPYMYVYYPTFGWRWVVAPWIFGWGPRPYWGPWGVGRFVWYSRPWFSAGGHRGYAGYRGYSGHGWNRGYGGSRTYTAHAYAGNHGGGTVHFSGHGGNRGGHGGHR